LLIVLALRERDTKVFLRQIKLEKVCDRYVTVLNNTLKPTKPFYKMMVEKHNVHPTKSQEKWHEGSGKIGVPSFL
jgi:benzoyl-CoA reductase/2-hydroxyglutaryl-CoA dehydratase subunit BcrC/BadD/HgdB